MSTINDLDAAGTLTGAEKLYAAQSDADKSVLLSALRDYFGPHVGEWRSFGTFELPAGWAWRDGTAISRSTYSALFGKVTKTYAAVTTNTSTTITGISSTTLLRVGMPVEGTGIPTGATIATIPSSTSITISAAATATGTPTLRFFQFGAGDGSTTFNLPDDRARVTANTSSTRRPGEADGAETVALTAAQSGLPAHSHGIADSGHSHNVTVVTPGGTGYHGGTDGGSQSSVTTETALTNITVVAADAASAAESHPNIQPTIYIQGAVYHGVLS